jgi:hypothetical protein
MRGARKPLAVDLNSRIEEPCGTIDVSLIPTPWPKDFWPPIIPNRITINNTKPEGAIPGRFPDCHLLLQVIHEDVCSVVFILYLLYIFEMS